MKPLSRLANLAISITDVQDMDPIFTNLPYNTNLQENVPLVSFQTWHPVKTSKNKVLIDFWDKTNMDLFF